ARAPRPLGPRGDPPAQALRAADGTGGPRRGPAVHLPDPARGDRPADGARQVRLGRRVPATVDAGELDPLLPHPFRGPAALRRPGAVVELVRFCSALERLALLGEREPAARSIAARRGPLGPEPDPLWAAMLRGEITERGYWRARSDEVGAALGRPGWPVTEFMHLLYGM